MRNGMATLWLGTLTPTSSSQTIIKEDGSPVSKENSASSNFLARALTAGQLGAIVIYGRCTDFSDGLVNRNPHFFSFSLPFLLPSVVYPASYDLGLGFLVCNPPVMPPVFSVESVKPGSHQQRSGRLPPISSAIYIYLLGLHHPQHALVPTSVLCLYPCLRLCSQTARFSCAPGT